MHLQKIFLVCMLCRKWFHKMSLQGFAVVSQRYNKKSLGCFVQGIQKGVGEGGGKCNSLSPGTKYPSYASVHPRVIRTPPLLSWMFHATATFNMAKVFSFRKHFSFYYSLFFMKRSSVVPALLLSSVLLELFCKMQLQKPWFCSFVIAKRWPIISVLASHIVARGLGPR